MTARFGFCGPYGSCGECNVEGEKSTVASVDSIHGKHVSFIDALERDRWKQFAPRTWSRQEKGAVEFASPRGDDEAENHSRRSGRNVIGGFMDEQQDP